MLYLKVIPIQELVTVKGSVLDVAAERLIGVRAGDVMGIVSIIGLAASVNAMTFAGPRVYFAMARDGVFLPAAARIHPTYKTPWIAIAGQAAWATVLILTGSLDALGNYVAFAITLFAGIAVGAVFVLRARDPHAPRPFKAIGYPLTPAIFVLFSVVMVANAIYREPRVTGLGLLLDRRGHSAVFLVHEARAERCAEPAARPDSSAACSAGVSRARRSEAAHPADRTSVPIVARLQPDLPAAPQQRHQREERQHAVAGREQQERSAASRGRSSRAGTPRRRHPSVTGPITHRYPRYRSGSRHGRA